MIKKIISILVIVVSILFIKTTKSQWFDPDFNPSYIISDFELTDYSSMNINDIRYFLNQNNGVLKKYTLKNPQNGKIVDASEVIYSAAKQYKINPKYLLVLLQKEQSLITDPNPSQKQLDWATGYAVCDSCLMTDDEIQKYKGFYNQVTNAAKRNRFYIDNGKTSWFFQVQKYYNIDGESISPINQATANLYNYTPHINGNYNFWKIWQKWFAKKYPNGSIVKENGSNTIWLIENDTKRPFITWASFISRYKKSDIINVNHNDLTQYPIGLSINFENYSYLKTPDKKIYLLDNDKLKEFESSEVSRYFGVNPEEITDITWEDFYYYGLGDKITMKSTYPSGALVENKDDKKLYYVKNGYKHEIQDPQILITNFPNQFKLVLSKDEIASLEDAEPIKFKDGTLIKSKNNNSVFMVSDGKIKEIKNEKSFNDLGYKWDNIITINENLLKQYSTSEAIDIKPEEIKSEDLLPENKTEKPL